MLSQVRQFIQTNQLLSDYAKVIVATSGGADSVALLHSLVQLDYQCLVAHVNFQLRGAESERDKDFTQKLAEKLGLQFLTISFDTKAYAFQQQISIEMAARELRYNWFEEIRQQTGAQAIAVAHHADDNAETFLMNLTRGTGVRGLTGIPVRNGHIIRPLLSCIRQDIETYLECIGQDYVTDSTNAENEFIRNKFRNQLIPLFETINPSFKSTLSDVIQRMQDLRVIFEKQINQDKKELCFVKDGLNYIEKQKLKATSYSHTLLYELLAPYGFSADNIQKINSTAFDSTGALFFSNNYRLLVDRDYLIISSEEHQEKLSVTISEEVKEISEPVRMVIRRRKFDGIIDKNKNIATFDASKLKFPLVIRGKQEGDYFYPFGMNGKKKVSDLLIDNKVNRLEKNRHLILTSDEKIAWVIGMRTDKRFAVDNLTTEVIEIQLIV